jgi:hypothetical protein
LVALSKRISQFGIDPIDTNLLKRIAAYTPIQSVDRFLKWYAGDQARLHSKAQASAAMGRRQNDHASGSLRRSGTAIRRWRLYPAGNLRDLENDILYSWDQLSYVGGVDPCLIVTVAEGEVRVPFRDVSGRDPRKILKERVEDSRGESSADGPRKSAALATNHTAPMAAATANVSQTTSRPQLPPGWRYFEPPARSTDNSDIAVRTSMNETAKSFAVSRFRQLGAPWFRHPDDWLQTTLVLHAKLLGKQWVYLKSNRCLIDVETQQVFHVYGWPARVGDSTRLELKGRGILTIPTILLLSP